MVLEEHCVGQVMRLPHASLTTEALGVDAVTAIQKATDVRTAKAAAEPLKFEIVRLPVELLALAPSLNSEIDVKANQSHLRPSFLCN